MWPRTGWLIVIYRIVVLRYHNLDYRWLELTVCSAVHYAASRITLETIVWVIRGTSSFARGNTARPRTDRLLQQRQVWPRHISSCFWQRVLSPQRYLKLSRQYRFGEYSTLNVYIQRNREGLTKQIFSSNITSDFGGARFEFRPGHHLFSSEAFRGFPSSLKAHVRIAS
jgi:hypothetical protein